MLSTFYWHPEEGMSLIEVMIGITILSIALIPILGYFVNSTKMVTETESRSIALNLAQQKMEEIKNIDFDNLNKSEITDNEDYGEIDIDSDGEVDYPNFKREVKIEGTDIKEVTVTVFWKNGNDSSVKLQTLIAKR